MVAQQVDSYACIYIHWVLLGLSLMATQDVESLQAHEPHSRRTHESPRLLSIFTAGRASNDHRSPSSLHLLRYLGANWHDDLWILNVSHLAHAFAPALARPTVSFVQDESFVRRDPSTGSVLSPPATADGRTTVDGRIKFDLRKPLDALAADAQVLTSERCPPPRCRWHSRYISVWDHAAVSSVGSVGDYARTYTPAACVCVIPVASEDMPL